MSALGDEINAAQQIAELQATAQRLTKQLAQAKAKTADLVDAVYRAASDAAITVGLASPVKPPKRDKRKGGEVALLHITDTHVGAVTESFNTDIAHERIRDTIAKTVKLTEIQREDHPVNECVVMLGGDHIEQTNQFPNQVWSVDGSTFKQVFDASAFLQEGILTLLSHFERVTVYSVPGNHGRIGRGKGRQSMDYESATNWDSICFKIMREGLAKQDRLAWDDNDEWYKIVSIGNYNALLHHGDTIRGFGGQIPAYGIIRKHLSWASGVMPEFQDAYLGHFHSPMTLPLAAGGRVFVTPSLVSDSSFAKEWVASTSIPAQRLHFIHPENGTVTGEFMLWL